MLHKWTTRNECWCYRSYSWRVQRWNPAIPPLSLTLKKLSMQSKLRIIKQGRSSQGNAFIYSATKCKSLQMKWDVGVMPLTQMSNRPSQRQPWCLKFHIYPVTYTLTYFTPCSLYLHSLKHRWSLNRGQKLGSHYWCYLFWSGIPENSGNCRYGQTPVPMVQEGVWAPQGQEHVFKKQWLYFGFFLGGWGGGGNISNSTNDWNWHSVWTRSSCGCCLNQHLICHKNTL